MKIRFLVLFLVLNISAQYSQGSRYTALKKGFSVNLIIGIPPERYGLDEIDEYYLTEDLKYNLIVGVQLGNRWYFSRSEKIGLGLMVNWLDLSMTQKGGSDNYSRATLVGSILEVGPLCSFALTELMALDGYYNFCPTLSSSAWVQTRNGENYGWAGAGTGFSHAFGTAFRYRALNIGIEYTFGKIKCNANDVQTEDKLFDFNSNLGSIRFVLGAKF